MEALSETWLLETRRLLKDVLSPKFEDKDTEEQRFILFGLKRKMREVFFLLEKGSKEKKWELFADNIQEAINHTEKNPPILLFLENFRRILRIFIKTTLGERVSLKDEKLRMFLLSFFRETEEALVERHDGKFASIFHYAIL